MQIRALIWDSFRDTLDRKIFWIMALLSVVVAAAMACIGFDEEGIVVLGRWQLKTDALAAGSPSARAAVGAIATKLLADTFLGELGIILALISTAGMFPNLMRAGTIDLILAKPMTRAHVFFGKYLGAMTFILVQATIFVLLTFLVMGVRWGHWLWGYLWVIPLMVLLFSYVYAFSALFGVLTRSATAAMLLTLVAWVGIWIPQYVHAQFARLEQPAQTTEWWQPLATGTRVARWIVPKTADIPVIAGELVGAGLVSDALSPDDEGLDPDDAAALRDAREIESVFTETVTPLASIGSSLASEAVIFLLAMLRFRKLDF